MDTTSSIPQTRTRSKVRQERTEKGETEDHQTPGLAMKSLVVEKLKVAKKNKYSERTYYSVSQDWAILKYWKDNRAEVSTREISDNLSADLDHSSESIRDRIKRYISKLKRIDETLIEEEAKVRVLPWLWLF